MKSKGRQNPNDRMLMESSVIDDNTVLFFGKERNRIGCQLRCQAIGAEVWLCRTNIRFPRVIENV